MSADIVFAEHEWSLEEAAVTMVHHGFRHLIVVDGGELAGVLSMRDIVRCWTDDGSSCELPAAVTAQAVPEGDSRRGLRSF
jgi:signal-transduction protein with cAMP-binding, CBS, and nucleotidyltransferase domain